MIHASLPSKVPLIVHIHDFFPTSHYGFLRDLKMLAPRVTQFWCVSPGIADFLLRATGRTAEVDPQFYTHVPEVFKTDYVLKNGKFRPCLIGNIWQNELLGDVKRIWQLAKAQFQDLEPISWHCHPDGVRRLREAGLEPLPEIVPAPFLSGDELSRRLIEYDLSIVPFSRCSKSKTDYERYSMPSRMTETASAGLPTFVLAGDDCALSIYVRERKIGVNIPSASHEAAATQLIEFARDASLRQLFGIKARDVAESEFPLQIRQQRLYQKLAQIASINSEN